MSDRGIGNGVGEVIDDMVGASPVPDRMRAFQHQTKRGLQQSGRRSWHGHRVVEPECFKPWVEPTRSGTGAAGGVAMGKLEAGRRPEEGCVGPG